MWNDPEQVKLLRAVREREASLAAMHMPQVGRLLEIGAGTGYQAKFFESIGFQVDAIDVKDSSHIGSAVFPIQIYDGLHIPFPNEAFDVVFSSNVLEHVPLCENLLMEMSRVLTGNGLMLHILPTASWRLWTSVAHYVMAFRVLLSLARLGSEVQPVTKAARPQERPRKKSFLRLLRAGLFPFRHGVKGNWLTEVYYFSKVRWRRTFQSAQLQVLATVNAGLFYTGYGIPGPGVSMAKRSELARWLGSASMLYILKKPTSR